MNKGRTTLVTGGGRGIGRASALRLAAAGHRVALTARTPAELDETAGLIRDAGGQCLTLAADLVDRASLASVVDRVEAAWGPIEILVNNAGVGSSADPRPLVDFDDDFWDFTLALNVTAPYLLTKRVLPAMIRARWGRIINIASLNAKIPSLHGAAYTASKHAVAGLTKATAKEVIEHGVTCNAVCPGVIATRMNDKRIEYDAKRLGASPAVLEAASSPLGRRLLPDEIAVAVAFLATEEAGAINGQLLNVCGGTIMD